MYEFGPFRLEPTTRRLLRQGEPVGLTPKAFDILLALVERRDRVVDKSELMQLVWPDSFVEEANLSQTVFVLRKTLGEDAGGRQFIDTVPRRGYRFGAEVKQPGAAIAAGQSARATSARWVAAVAASAALVGGVAVWMSARSNLTASDPMDGKTRVAVLPFENLTRNAADDWLASAFSASLTSGLQRAERLVPVSRDRIIELYRQRDVREASAVNAAELRQLADVLDVRYFVHGSYQRIGEGIRVTAQLIDVTEGTVRSQETVTDAFSNLLALEDELAERFVERLEAGRRARSGSAETASLDAYRATIEGQTLYAESRYNEALAPLTRATTADPRYASAWALLSKTNARLSTISFISSGSADQLTREALTCAHRAVQLAPSSYDAQVALALASREIGDVERWRAAALKAISLNPAIAEAHGLLADSFFAGNAFACGRDRDPQRAESHYRIAIRLDPRWPAPYANLAYHWSWLGREPAALAVAEEGLAVLPHNPTVVRARAHALVRLGRQDEAERDIRRLIERGAAISGQDHLILGSIALARGDLELATREFQTSLSRLATTAFPLAIGRAYLEAGRLDEGLAHLDRAVRMEPSCATFIATSPAFASHRDTPAFAARLATWKPQGA